MTISLSFTGLSDSASAHLVGASRRHSLSTMRQALNVANVSDESNGFAAARRAPGRMSARINSRLILDEQTGNAIKRAFKVA